MISTLRQTLLLTALVTIPTVALAQSDSIAADVKKSMAMEYRTEAERARDEDRTPVEALEFMGLRNSMKVIEFFPAGQAYYTKIIAPILADKGELYVIDSQRTFDRWGDLLNDPALKSTKKILTEADYIREERRYKIGEIKVPVTDADLFLNIREYHNMNAADKKRLNKIAFDALKPGGRYVVIDHTRRHMQTEDGAGFRREDPVQVIVEVQDAGFTLEKVSDMFYQESDDLTKEVGDKSVAGNTDRFFLVFRKP